MEGEQFVVSTAQFKGLGLESRNHRPVLAAKLTESARASLAHARSPAQFLNFLSFEPCHPHPGALPASGHCVCLRLEW